MLFLGERKKGEERGNRKEEGGRRWEASLSHFLFIGLVF